MRSRASGLAVSMPKQCHARKDGLRARQQYHSEVMLCLAYQRGKRRRQGLPPRKSVTDICLLHCALIINTPDSSLAIRPRTHGEQVKTILPSIVCHSTVFR